MNEPVVNIAVYDRGGPGGGYRAVIDRGGWSTNPVVVDNISIAVLLRDVGIDIATALGER